MISSQTYHRLRRPFDMVVALGAVVILSPVLCVAAVLVKLDGGPVFFRQDRVGRHGVIFQVLKFRTMIVDADRYLDDRGMPTRARITRVGQFLRRSSIDELPQFYNIIIGDMGLIGPRPILPRMLPFMTDVERQRLAIRPGVSGWAQVSGRNMIPWSRRFVLDVDYIRNSGPKLDLLIVWKTLLTLIKADDISNDRNADVVDDITIRPLSKTD